MPSIEDPIEKAINAAIDKAENGGELPAAEETVAATEAETEEGAAEGTEGAGPGEQSEEVEETTEADTEPAAKTEEAAVKIDEPKESAEDAEITKLLEEHGIKAPKKGERVNSIPYPRVRKITGNFIKKVRTQHQQELSTRDTKIKDYEGQLTAVQRANQLIETNADRYILTLAAMYPDQYGKFVKGGTVESPAAPTVTAEANDPEPTPDVRYEDGSVGYSPEQWNKLREWDRRSAARAAVAESEKRYGPMVKSFNETQDRAQRLPVYQAEVERIRAIYGDVKDPNNPFTLDEQKAGANGDPGQSEILQYLRTNSRFDASGRLIYKPSLAEAAAAVLTPKLHAAHTVEINKRRQEWLAEQKKRPNAATVPARSSKPMEKAPKPGERDLSDVIEESLQKAGI
jgi:hypothetical protein